MISLYNEDGSLTEVGLELKSNVAHVLVDTLMGHDVGVDEMRAFLGERADDFIDFYASRRNMKYLGDLNPGDRFKYDGLTCIFLGKSPEGDWAAYYYLRASYGADGGFVSKSWNATEDHIDTEVELIGPARPQDEVFIDPLTP